MSSEQAISYADLSYIEGSLNSLEQSINDVSNQVDSISDEVLNVKSNLNSLIQEFQEFIEKDMQEKNLQLAETRIVKVRQELKTEFGHYGEVRRRVSGILQAVDVGLVRKETVENSTEEHMLSAPRYWLAPCLIALSAWLNDNQELANKAMMEALRRDDEKTSLFFALVTRRGARYKSSGEWIDRYFGLQHPDSLEREIVILIDGFSNGIFGPNARIKCGKTIESWISELSDKEGFIEEQKEQWKVALQMKIKTAGIDSYSYLKEYSSTWPQLEESLLGAQLHKIIHDYLSDIMMREITPAKSIAFAVDALLDTLVSKFDDEELPLRRDERLLSLIIQENGDRVSAQNLFNNEKILEESVSFTQLLTNFAMYPEVSNASLATQKLSIALSKDWIKHAHEDLTVENRAGVPIDVELDINHWVGSTEDGSNEKELVHSLKEDMEKRKLASLRRVKLSVKHWASLAGGLVFAYLGFATTFLFVFALFCFVYFYLGRKNVNKQKLQIIDEYRVLHAQSEEALRASLAELVDWRNEYANEDSNSSLVSVLLDTITPEQYSFSSHDPARSIVS